MNELAFHSLHELIDLLQKKDCSSVDITRVFLDRIDQFDHLHAFIHVDAAAALRDAAASDQRRRDGRLLGPLDGVPFALKDSSEISGQVVSNGSASRLSEVCSGTASIVKVLRGAGAVLLGRTHMVEFAFGGWGTNPLLGAPWNPWDLSCHRVPGGSSSGSAVAVAAALAPVAIGTDTGGSIRNPAALCGVTGLKTTVGLISAEGIFPLSPTFDSVGPLTRDAYDAALMCGVMSAGRARMDADPFRSDLRGVKIATFPEHDLPSELNAEVYAAYSDAIRVLRTSGATLCEIALPFNIKDLIFYNARIISAEAWEIHKKVVLDEARPVGDAVRTRIKLGATISQQEYRDALAQHHAMKQAWFETMNGIDAMVMPTVPIYACPIDSVDETATHTAYFNRIANHVGGCALSVPAGFSGTGMPIGVQFVGKPFDEATVIRIGAAFQVETDWHRRHPQLLSKA